MNDIYNCSTDVFSKQGVLSFLNDYRHIIEMGTYSYDVDALDLRLTFEQALMSDALLENERIVLALIYGLELNFVQASKIMGIPTSQAKELIADAVETIEAVLNGYTTYTHVPSSSTAKSLEGYIAEVRAGKILIYDINECVTSSLLHHLAGKRDKLAKETIRQQIEGIVLTGDNGLYAVMGWQPYSLEQYPYYDTAPSIESADIEKHDRREYDYFKDRDSKMGIAPLDNFTNVSVGFSPNLPKKRNTVANRNGRERL